MSGPIDVDAKVKQIVGNRDAMARKVPAYDKGQVHHVLELQLLYTQAGGVTTLRQDDVARLLFYAQQNGLFDINGVQNALVLPSNAALAGALGKPVHTGSHVESYNTAIRTRLGEVFMIQDKRPLSGY